jgi:hypothetical protein
VASSTDHTTTILFLLLAESVLQVLRRVLSQVCALVGPRAPSLPAVLGCCQVDFSSSPSLL